METIKKDRKKTKHGVLINLRVGSPPLKLPRKQLRFLKLGQEHIQLVFVEVARCNILHRQYGTTALPAKIALIGACGYTGHNLIALVNKNPHLSQKKNGEVDCWVVALPNGVCAPFVEAAEVLALTIDSRTSGTVYPNSATREAMPTCFIAKDGKLFQRQSYSLQSYEPIHEHTILAQLSIFTHVAPSSKELR
ncbi:5670_t:CDS:2 [Paraglomus brasilianum]|uniref:5670_t:CDS:1 n=1 Tax=Paraglomus brasilianum TaxID=144538 RepID=A0A9N9DVP9_9GLOM|nr:5670_t:CDS:2 [Paraglomus brasilianum]